MLTCHPPAGVAGDAPAGAVWIDLLEPTDAEVQRVQRTTGLEVPTRAALEEIESSSRLRSTDAALYLSLPFGVHPTAVSGPPEPLGFVLSPRLLITVRFARTRSFDRVHERLTAADAVPASGPEIFATLLEEMIDVGADMLERLGAELGTVSREIFGAVTPAAARARVATRLNRRLQADLRQVGATAELLSHIRETLLGLQRVLDFSADRGQHCIGPEVLARLKSVRGDLVSLIDFETHLSDKSHFLLDAVLGFINTEQNEIFRVLTVVSVVGVPPTLIASMYGMNFHNMPEYAWRYGYQYALVLIALSILAPVLWFKWRGWW